MKQIICLTKSSNRVEIMVYDSYIHVTFEFERKSVYLIFEVKKAEAIGKDGSVQNTTVQGF